MLRRELNAIKREQFPWMLEVTKNAPQMAIIQLGNAFQNFFKKRANYPQFRKKGINDRFTLTNDQFALEGSRIRIPHLGWVQMRESLRFIGKIISATISRKAGRWFASSKRCSSCHHVLNELPLSVREWKCPSCDANHHRDVNAAINLKNWAVSSTVTACGATSDGVVAFATASHVAMKQEANTISALN